MIEYYMDCSKCHVLFNEKEIQNSHDIPKYLGGTDKDGRHWLCKKCHEKYEHYIFTRVANYISNIDERLKEKLRSIAHGGALSFFKK